MAVLCTKCSAEVPASAQFCAACGTPVAAPQPPVAAAPPAYTPVAPLAAGPGMAAPQKSGPSAVKIILIVLAVFIGLGVIGAGAVGFMVWRIAHSIRVSGPNGEVSVNTPGGHITAGGDKSYTAEELGTDLYPGAQSAKGGMRMDLPTGSMTTGVFLTSDSKDAVVAFYKNKLGSGVSSYDGGNTAMLTVKRSEQETVMVTISSKDAQSDGKTKIVIMHTKTTRAS